MSRISLRLRDWLLFLCWQGVILSTGPASFAVFRSSRFGLWRVWTVLVAALLLVAAFPLASRLWRRRAPLAWIAALLVFALAAWAVQSAPTPVARVHFVLYGVLAALALRAWRHQMDGQLLYLAALAVCMLGGILDETLQGFMARRVGDVADLALNLWACLLSLAGIYLYQPAIMPQPIQAGSIRLTTWLFAAALLFLAVFMTVNPDRPIGYRYTGGPEGTFYSVLTLDELRTADARLAVSSATELADWRPSARIELFSVMWEEFKRQPVDERACRVFMQVYSHFLYRNQLMDRVDIRGAWRETQVGDRLYDSLLSATPLPWESIIVNQVAELLGGATEAAGNSTFLTASAYDPETLRGVLRSHRNQYMDAVKSSFSAQKRFFLNYTSPEPFLRELRWHLFRRYHGASVADYYVACGENRILERYFGRCTALARYAWPASAETYLLSRLPKLRQYRYESIVGKDYMYMITLREVWTTTAVGVAIILLVGEWAARRRRVAA